MKLSSNKYSPLILVSLVAILALFAIYYYVVLPKQEMQSNLITNTENNRVEIKRIQEEISTLENNKEDLGLQARLEKQVPKERGVEYVLRDLEKIEVITGSRIESISFNEYDVELDESKFSLPTTVETTAEDNIESNKETDDELSEESLEESNENAPEGLQTITYQVELLTPDYKTLRTFIREVEGLERIIKIDVVQLSQPGEEVKFEEVVDYTVSASLQLTTFFYNE